ncbi:MAG: glycoside hydrolase family 3 N-terminal domain-containing protein [Acidimicrobiales bacterium]
MRRRAWATAAAALVMSATALAPPAASTTASPGNLACAEAVVTKWSLPALAAETVVVPVDASAILTMVPAARDGFGGVILFGSNAPTTLAASLGLVQAASASGYALLVMTDEEGGGVWRLANLVPAIPWAQTMGRTLTPEQITALARRVGATLVKLGVTVDLAPVLDVDARAVAPGAGDPDGFRSFGGSPTVVAADGTAFLRGLTAASETGVVKHFPGLGGTTVNTDVGPAKTKPWSALQRTGLVPFKHAIADGAPAVMLSNASVPGLTSLPASVSPAAVHALRVSLGFTGLIVTDSLSAGALSAIHLSVPQAAVAALRAGADEVLFGVPAAPATSLSLALQVRAAIVSAVVHGSLARATLVAAAAEVLNVRHNLCATTSTT